ncbi:ABC transporter permease [Mycoplasma sp. 392]
MIRLLKEVFKSLSKNKITVIGLTILMFITCGIFTLLFDVKKSYTTTLKNFSQVSRQQDLTVDLDVNPSGTAPNEGYSQVDDNGNTTTQPDIYVPEENTSFNSVERNLNIPTEYMNYLPLEKLTKNSNDKGSYVDTESFQTWFWNSLRGNRNVVFDFENNKIKFLDNEVANLYKVVDNEYVLQKSKTTIDKNTQFKFIKPFKLSDIAKVINTSGDDYVKKDDYLVNPGDLFINPFTQEATFDISQYQTWDLTENVLVISGSNVLKSLGFVENNGRWYFSNSAKDLSFKNKDDVTKRDINPNAVLNDTFSLTNYFLDNNLTILEFNKNATKTFSSNDEYTIPTDWVQTVEKKTEFIRRNYKLNWDYNEQESKSNWTGTYLTYISQIYNQNNKQLPKDIKEFSYWVKNISTRRSIGNNSFGSWNSVLENISPEDTTIKLATKNNQPTSLTKDTIREIEGYDDNWTTLAKNQWFKNISDTSILQQKRNNISSGASKIAQNSIIDEVISKAGLENVGLRKTITVDNINDEENTKTVFHFINTGDRNMVVDGVKQNVGKMFNEQSNPSILNSSINPQNLDEYLLVKDESKKDRIYKLPSIYASSIITYIYRGYTPDPAYLDVNVLFENYTDYYPETKIPYQRAAKIVTLTSEKTNTINVQYGITKAPSKSGATKYIILELKNVNGQEIWQKALFSNQSSELTIEQLSDFLIKNNLTINAKIGDNGWAKIDSVYKNSTSLPLLVGSVDSNAVEDITQNNSIGVLIKQIKDAVLSTQLSKIITENQLDRILYSGQLAVEKNKFHNLLATGKTNDQIVQLVIFDWLYNLTQPLNIDGVTVANTNGNAFIYSIFNNIINYIRSEYQKQATDEQKRQYLSDQLNSIESLISSFTGATNGLLGNIIPNFRLGDLTWYIKDFEALLSSVSQLISSLDFIKFSTLVHNWYQQHPYKIYSNPNSEYWILSNEEKLNFLLQSFDELKLKTALKSLVSQINFNALLNPSQPHSIYQLIVKSYVDADKELSTANRNSIKTLFEKFNAYKDGSKEPYSNVAEGLNELIDLFSLKNLTQSFNYFLAKNLHKIELVIGSISFKNNYTRTIKQNEFLASVIASISQVSEQSNTKSVNKFKQFKEALTTIFNLSSATYKPIDLIGLQLPAEDKNKISITDVGLFSLLGFAKKDSKTSYVDNSIGAYDLDKMSALRNKIAQGNSDLTIEETNFLSSVVQVSSADFNDLAKVVVKLDNYINLVKKLKLQNYGLTSNQVNLTFKDDVTKQVKSFGDLAYRSALLNPQDPVYDGYFKLLYNNISPLLKQFMANDTNGTINQELVLFSPWISLAYQLRNSRSEISLTDVQKILLNLFEFAQSQDVKNIVLNYGAVANPIPSFGSILGADENNNATKLKISYGLSDNLATTQQVINANIIDKFIAQLPVNLQTNNQIIKQVLSDNIYQLVQQFSLINSATIFPTFFVQSQKEFLNSFIKSNASTLEPLVVSDYELDILYRDMLAATKLSKTVSIFGLNSAILNPYIALSFPQILLWSAITEKTNVGNLKYILDNLPNTIETMSLDQLAKMLEPLYFAPLDKNAGTNESEGDKNIELDVSYLNWISAKISSFNNNNPVIFGLNINDIFRHVFYSATGNIVINNLIVYSDSASYLAKVNNAFLTKNNKEVYKGDLSKYLSNPFLMAQFVSQLDPKYKIVINSLEYVIIGDDISADYLYPVINEENLQVDTKKQALVYVNEDGFDRVVSAYPTFAIKKYLLVDTNGDKKKAATLKSEFNNFIRSISINISDKSYLAEELDPLNPERSIRIKLINSIITAIGAVQTFSIMILIILVAISVYFIIRRYINVRNKVIGILRSQGYRSREIAFAFSSFCWLSTFIGGLSGYIVGHFAQPAAFRVFSSYWTLQTTIIGFNWWTLLVTIAIPIITTSALIFLITYLSMRIKPIEMMSGLSDLQIGPIAQRIAVSFRKLPLKSRFVAMLTLNNFWKLFSLFISFAITALITTFSLSSFNVFPKSINRTYQNRSYTYKMDLETPTTEGGPYALYNKNDLEDLLYMPDDLSASASSTEKNQNDYNSPYFFKPGYTFNTDVVNKPFAPSVLTKSSLDIALDTSVELSPWDIVYASLPETQKARVVQIFKKASSDMMLTQFIWNANTKKRITDVDEFYKTYDMYGENGIYATATENNNAPKVSWFLYQRANQDLSSNSNEIGKFVFIEYDKEIETYKKAIIIKTDKVRVLYRDFLLNASRNGKYTDFFMSFGGVLWNDNTNEKYSYAKTIFRNQNINVYGYKDDSKFVTLENQKGKNLLSLINTDFDFSVSDEEFSKNTLPIIINNLSANKYNLSIGSVIEMQVTNNINRFVSQIVHSPVATKYHFKVVGINNTYINNEFITSKKIVDKITGLDKLSTAFQNARMSELNALEARASDEQTKQNYRKWYMDHYEAFNGILSSDPMPYQTTSSLTTYSSSGYWGAIQTYNANTAGDKSVTSFFKKLFVGYQNADGQTTIKPMFQATIESYNAINNANEDWQQLLAQFLNVDEKEVKDINYNGKNNYHTWGDETLESKPIANPAFRKNMIDAINKFYAAENSIYGKDILYAASNNVNSKDIEAGFIEEISKTITSITVAFVVISFIVSIVILIMITNSMVSANERNIATFSILGYTSKEKIYLFFFNYIPVILIASLLMIPVTLALIAGFQAFLIATSQMVLPLTLYYSTILLSIILALVVFAVTSIFAWIGLNKIKPIYLLKGK